MTGQRHLLTKPAQSRFRLALISLTLLGTGVGCLPSQSSKTELTMQVRSSGQPGVYTIVGTTNLPNQTRMTIQAVRSLRPVSTSRLTNQEQTYAILARQPIEVIDGKWETTLSLLKPGINGQSLENWQTHNAQLGLNLQPDDQVAFQAVTDPINRSLNVEQQSGNTTPGESLIVRFTADGKSYLQSEQALSIAPPAQTSKTSSAMNQMLGTPATVTVQVVSKQIKEPSKGKKQLNAPLAPAETLR